MPTYMCSSPDALPLSISRQCDLLLVTTCITLHSLFLLRSRIEQLRNIPTFVAISTV